MAHTVVIRLSTGEREELGKAKNLTEVWQLHLKYLCRFLPEGKPFEDFGVFRLYDLAPQHEVERITGGRRLVWSWFPTTSWAWHLRYS